MAVKLIYNKVEQFADGTGVPYSGAKLFSYVGGSVNTKATTYTESTGTTPNTNPIVLDSAGRLPQPLWMTTGTTLKLVLAPSTDTDPPASPIWTLDGITGINDSSASQSEWIAGPTPTFVSATSFTLVGDQTTNFHIGRRLKTTNTSGTVYSTITNSVFGALTTITVENDSGVLDSGLSAVSYGIVSQNNESDPAFTDQAPVVVNKTDRTKRQRLSAANITAAATRVLTLQDANISLGNIAWPAKGRLTLTTATPVTTADVTAATTVFYTPYQGDTIQLYDGNDWNTHKFTELSQLTTDATKSPAAVAINSNYDIFVWIDAGTLRATRGPLWTSDTVRGTGAGTTELEFFEGRWVNKVAITNGPGARKGHYGGSVRSDGSSQINDSQAKRHVWNNYNRVPRPMKVVEATSSWAYTINTYRQANAAAANQLDIVIGLSEIETIAEVYGAAANNTAVVGGSVGIGLDSTSVDSATIKASGRIQTAAVSPLNAKYKGFPGIGRHTLVWLEKSAATGISTWVGNDSADIQTGIVGTVLG